MRKSLVALLIVAAVTAGGCAATLPEVGPEQIPGLEERVAAEPADLEARTRLGMAYHGAERYADARGVLAAVVEEEDAPPAAHLYLGLTHEALGRQAEARPGTDALEHWRAARAAYQRYLELDGRGDLADQVRGRHALMVRHELQAESRATLAREAELADRAPAPRTLAVFPFRLVGGDESLEPLTAALADMMTTDLEASGALRMLERVRVQSMLREMALTEAGYAEPGTGARAGRLLGAEHVVQGVISNVGGELRMDVSVVNTPRRAPTGQPVVAESALEGLFDAEKRLVLGILDVLGVQLTAAEREAIEENRAGNVLAFLAYGRGVQALDEGDFEGATAAFSEAVRLDPGFQAAQVRQAQTAQLRQAATVSTGQFSQIAVQAAAPSAPADVTGKSAELVQQIADELVPTPAPMLLEGAGTEAGQQASTRDPVTESQNTEGTTKPPTATIRITIPNPTRGGGQ